MVFIYVKRLNVWHCVFWCVYVDRSAAESHRCFCIAIYDFLCVILCSRAETPVSLYMSLKSAFEICSLVHSENASWVFVGERVMRTTQRALVFFLVARSLFMYYEKI